ncbi:MAG: sugar ABC transporter permease [Clostridia bacterium]|nr:sugar ABC transporter permease [Clostridia bacterium]
MKRSVFGKMSMTRKRSLSGLIFVAPWLVGVIWFFIVPMCESFLYMFNDVIVRPGGLEATYVGFDIIREVLADDPDNVRMMLTSVMQTLGESVLIVAFSLFIGIILSNEFKGRTVARAVFALPIIVSSGVVLAVFKEDLFATSITQNSDMTIFQSAALENAMLELGLNPSIVDTLTGLVSNILDLIWKCGVQILLFTAGIKSIPAQMYEVCRVEGANAWQTFWKVTFPLVTPYILLNAVYSIIDSFTYYSNPVMQRILRYFNELYTSSGTTLAVAYCLLALVVTGVVAGLISRKVFYIEK